MAFYDLSKEERNRLVEQINLEILTDLSIEEVGSLIKYFSDEDTYIRKTGYLAIGKIFYAQKQLQSAIFSVLEQLFQSDDELIRQTVINAAGEIGKFHFDKIQQQRARPTRWIQTVQAQGQKRILDPARDESVPFKVPAIAKWLPKLPILRDLPARVIGSGLGRVSVEVI